MSQISKEGLLKALARVDDPDLHKDLVTLNMVNNIKIDGNDVSVDIVLTTPACPLKDKIESDCREAITSDFPQIKKLNINMTSKVATHNFAAKNAIIPGVKNTIAVASGKGGVGKSTVAVNLAVALAKEGASVGLIDADIYGPSIPLMLGIKEKPKVYQDKDTMKMIPLTNFGIKLMSIGFLIDENTPIIWRGPMASGAVKQFLSDVDWEELDYLIFDMPPGTGDIQLTLCQTIPLTGAVIVTTPQEVSLTDARKALKMFARVNVPVLGVVENMSCFIAPDTGLKYDIFGTGGGQKLADEENVPFLGGIPLHQNVRVGGDKGIPIVYDLPDSEHAKTITAIAKNLAQQISIRNLGADSLPIEILIGDNN
ncbi:MAG: iron-sulfur cluster carrier protein ApbC [Ignavibacteria bacterium]|nr:iron-sulfur cluster carrier protein ApbC [Ignavibacteria bacterium]MDP3831654.1 iron-sulfur cluster carrier protein ApbC [Ignavibacteriaceae bacterium]